MQFLQASHGEKVIFRPPKGSVASDPFQHRTGHKQFEFQHISELC